MGSRSIQLPPEHVENIAAGIITVQAQKNSKGEVVDFTVTLLNRIARQCIGPLAREFQDKPIFSHWPKIFTQEVLASWSTLMALKTAEITTFPNLFSPGSNPWAVSAFSSGELLTFTILSHSTDIDILQPKQHGNQASPGVIPNLIPADNAAEYLSLIINTVPNPIFIKDEQRRFVLLNDVQCEFLKMARKDLLGKNDYQLFPTEQADHFWRMDSEVFLSEDPVETEEVVTDASGFTSTILTRKATCELSNGQKLLVGIITDLTERKQMEEQLRNSQVERDRALELNRTKNLFLANMSHELRTPLNAIIGYAELIGEEAEDNGYTELTGDLSNIQSAAHHLLVLISDILDLTKIEAGRMEILSESFALEDLLAEVHEVIKPLAEKNKNSFTIEKQQENTQLKTDRIKLKQILLNLLSNAVKFTQEGQVKLKFHPPNTEAPNQCIFSVEDTGVGIPTEKLGSIFNAFTQADLSSTRRFGGTGLGLTIASQFSEMLGGKVDVKSEVGIGSTFTVQLPKELLTQIPSAPA